MDTWLCPLFLVPVFVALAFFLSSSASLFVSAGALVFGLLVFSPLCLQSYSHLSSRGDQQTRVHEQKHGLSSLLRIAGGHVVACSPASQAAAHEPDLCFGRWLGPSWPRERDPSISAGLSWQFSCPPDARQNAILTTLIARGRAFRGWACDDDHIELCAHPGPRYDPTYAPSARRQCTCVRAPS